MANFFHATAAKMALDERLQKNSPCLLCATVYSVVTFFKLHFNEIAQYKVPSMVVVSTTPSYQLLNKETESSSGHLQWPIPNHFSFGYTMVYKKSPFAQSWAIFLQQIKKSLCSPCLPW